ncbi:cytochrome c oxidase assembly protein [Pelagibacterium flavum]|mgnify:CR=1 FL=1|uniref:Cytochrome c oxidase assembly protein n=1 Tax=Pelagibacterium flavum TaxID=2984530 RepID=A0ABY6IMQ1_9HYPH|nr:cytochrome c oxidase assembly protein [Pelagibacterium sp. YIM 151497]UYQ71654.1 cytochrome c oxidase assembly protein [Pelagibacterium sp. YIM 151497]|tara:strand:+ start:2079 stop:2600 length:522 start_codon:yes stop_codon:yes gene_type:complete
MLTHIIVMNLLVPAVLFGIPTRWIRGIWRYWPYATTAQLALLWGWHSPPVLDAAMGSQALTAAMHLTLAFAAAGFWAAIIDMPATGRWRSIFALLITGKLFCLLGVLLVFAPRSLYGAMGAHGDGAAMLSPLADQQLAGLIMVAACPLTYVLAGIWIAARWFLALEAQGRMNA